MTFIEKLRKEIITKKKYIFTKDELTSFTKDELLDNFTVTMKFATYYPHSPKYFDYFNSIFNFNPSDMVHLKGSDYWLVAPERVQYPARDPKYVRAYLFGEKYGAKLDNLTKSVTNGVETVQKYADKVNGVVDGVTSALNHAGGTGKMAGAAFAAVMSGGSSLSLGGGEKTETASNVNYPFRGKFEFFAKYPGVYTSVSKNGLEDDRIIYKLGFSY